MKQHIIRRIGLLLVLGFLGGCQAANNGTFEVRNFGAHGDGKHLDTPAVNEAIDAASKAGGGTVHFSAGNYLCYSIHLKSNVTLYLDWGATIRAAGKTEKGEYDPPEPFPFADQYQDFGHTHWHNSLIWGENIENVAIMGPGGINGKDALNRGSARRPTTKPATSKPTTEPWQDTTQPDADTVEPWEIEAGPGDVRPGPLPEDPDGKEHHRWRWATSRISPDIDTQDYAAMFAATQPSGDPTTKPTTKPEYPDEKEYLAPGIGNKAISLKNVHGCILRDFSIYEGGHFGILATAVDDFTIDDVKIDTNRDGMDIDCCRNVRISNCTVNSPNDDAIVLKSSFGLGYARDTENVTISDCLVSGGYEEGTMLNGKYKKIGPNYATDKEGLKHHVSRTGRIKFGTESNGGFKNITITNCLFDDCQGLAIESVDGGVIDNVTVSNLAMRDVVSSPIFVRLGERMRGPKGTPVGAIRHVSISNIVAQAKSQRYACFISGTPGHEIEDLRINNVRVIFPGGGKGSWTRKEPSEMVKGYPDPSRFGGEPAYGFFIRHVKGLQMTDVDITAKKSDLRPAFYVKDVQGFYLNSVSATRFAKVPMFVMDGVKDFRTVEVDGVADMRLKDVGREDF
jgi:polygalacturonase